MKVLLLFLALITGSMDHANHHADSIIGIWQNGTGKGHIQIYKQGAKYFGKIIWLKEPMDKNTGRPKLDSKNPDPAQRNNPIIGLIMMRNFTYDNGEWTGGHIYNPQEGKEYKAYLKMQDQNTLLVRGYIGISLIGKTDTWVRVR